MNPIDLGDGLTVWITERGMLGYAVDLAAELPAYYKLRRKLARQTLKAEGSWPNPWIWPSASHIAIRCADFERILSSSHVRCPEEWRAAITQLRERKERIFAKHTEAQRRAKAWYAAQQTALAAD